ncbi:MAG: histidine kinase [Bacteroidota bacterium]
MRLLKIQVLLFILSVISCRINGQDMEYEQFTTDDGLPSMKIYNMREDSNGVLWMGTENGLVSYDGEEFVRYSHPELIDNDIIRIEANGEGKLFFINLSNQLGYIQKGSIQIIDTKLDNMAFRNICFFDDKMFLVSMFQKSKIVHELIQKPKDQYEFKVTPYYSAIEGNGRGKYIFKKENGKITYTDKTIKVVKTGIAIMEDKIYMSKLFNEGSFVFYSTNSALLNFCQDKTCRGIIKEDEKFYMISNLGIYYYDPSDHELTPFLEDTRVNTIFFDSDENAWITTAYNGLLRIKNLNHKLKGDSLNLSGGINAIYVSTSGQKYLGTTSSELIIDPLNKSQTITISNQQRPVTILQDDDEILAFDEKAIIFLSERDSLKIRYIYTSGAPRKILFKNDEAYMVSGRGFFLGSKGLFFENGAFGGSHNDIEVNKKEIIISYDSDLEFITDVDDILYLADKRIATIFSPKAQEIVFMGTIEGLFYRVNDTIDIVKNETLKSTNISKLIGGSNNSLWIGTRTDGVYNYRNDSILYHYTTKNGLSSNNANNIELHSDELLISTNLGLNILNLETKEVKIISTYNYLPSNEVLVCKVIEEEYWIGTIDGLTVLSREEVNAITEQGPKLSIKGLYVNGQLQEHSETMVFDHTVNNIQLNFRNICHKSGNNKLIKYRIPSIDTFWNATKDLEVRLPSLKPGEYKIEAMGVNAIGIEGNRLNFRFKINPPWWNTLWAKVLWVLLLVGIGSGAMLRRVRRIRKEEALKRDYLTQINRIKDQALQLQMNPHFIFNSLNAIQGFIGTDEEEKAMNFLARFARLIRLIFEHSKGNTITLEEELEFINLYLDLEKLRFKDKVSIEVDVGANIESMQDVINVSPLLIQPIVENSFKHGLFHKKGQGRLLISYRLENQLLKVVIEDNGIGRTAAQKIIQKNTEKHVSSGIKTTLERIEILNFDKNSKQNRMDIEDLYDQWGKPCGTKTILILKV